MRCSSKFIYSADMLQYHFHNDHPFNQKRVLLTKELLETSSLLDETDIIAPRKATEDELALFHDRRYIEAVKKAGAGLLSPNEAMHFGLDTDDTPVFDHMHEASSYLVGGTLTAVDAVLNGQADHALNLGGGLHHGFKRKASGFCIYNDGAIAIEYIRKNYGMKVLYVDTDAHHGDGVQWAFYEDSDVCTLSIHETGRYLFPGTGNVNERGIKSGHGYTFNVPIDAFTEDASFIHIYETALRHVIEFFKPDVIVTQNGADAHMYDPLTHLCSTMETFEAIPLLAHKLAHEYCDGRWIATGGGGYDMWRAVPRAWAQIWSVMKTGQVQTGLLPDSWCRNWNKKSPVELPLTWHDSPNIVPDIPRAPDIAEKNDLALQQVLKYAPHSKTCK
ncbi:Acetoin utilization protein AcuC [Lentibacillus sp. JNUCC-1]|uniref:acetoin utilization protein AcuC n=1 Tax=Lentibacillus sp. JNUCC-1 TaxID=2654513 RepID=UPI0012E7E937|nr:acetoin utilization protein AcuC [Lentibacillus sp. JNUCC-1]MUV39301.1 Acetoin utilization protein AcuC [Lentibacillus sp. JNUCC-1]